jgi:hypothetical protein
VAAGMDEGLDSKRLKNALHAMCLGTTLGVRVLGSFCVVSGIVRPNAIQHHQLFRCNTVHGHVRLCCWHDVLG